MKNKKIISVFSFVFALIMVLPLFSVFISANSVIPQHIDTSHVSDDLKRMEAYDADRYGIDKTVDYCEIVDLIEYGYAYNGSTANYALYLYIYNPSCTTLIVENNVYNRVQLRVPELDEEIAGGETPWAKYSMTFLSRSSDKLFYKFRIDVPKSFMREVQMGQRVYEIADVELLYEGDVMPRSVGASGKWIYSGYQEYHGPYNGGSTTSTLSWTSTVLETLELDLNSASWKTKTSDKGFGFQYELSSVYFAVPNKIIKDYGDLSDATKGLRRVKGVYNNFKVCGVSTASESFYETLSLYTDLSCYVYDTPFAFITTPYYGPDGVIGNRCTYAFNADDVDFDSAIAWYVSPVGGYIDNKLSKFGNAFRGSVDFITKENFDEQLLDLYSKGNLLGRRGTYSDNELDITTNSGDFSQAMRSYADEYGEHKLWYFFTGSPNFIDEDIGQIDPIVVVNETDLALNSSAFGDKYFVTESDAADLSSYVQNNVLDSTTFLLRFAVTDYFCSDIYVPTTDGYMDFGTGNYYFEKEVFMDFDILSLTWENKNGVHTVLPVKSSPINATGTPSTPAEKDDFWERVENTFVGGKDDNWFDGLRESLKILLVLIVVILIVVLISKVPGLAKAIGTVIALPFKAVGGLIGTVSDASESRERRKKSKAERKEISSRQADREADRAARKAEKDADREERRRENEARRAERAAQRSERASRRTKKNKKEDE